jgi:16S rRNA C967 or C1407 C5-methylase (RsmB/RsmF family)
VEGYDSRPDTYKHIQVVQGLLGKVLRDFIRRSEEHDQSKLYTPEVEMFDEFTSKLATSTYGSDEYKSFLKALEPALAHHYANNSHHPEHYPDGIRGMNLLDVLEMLCDWKAATLRHNDGDIRKSIEINQGRFGYSDELKQLFYNTLPLIEG